MTLPLFPLGINFGPVVAIAAPNRTEYVNYQNHSTINDSRYINPDTKDYELQANGHFVGMSSLQQEVMLAVSTQFNSGVLTNFGLDLRAIKLITPNINKQVFSLFANALSDLISGNKIKLNNVNTVKTAIGQISTVFSWTDITTGTSYQSNILLRA